MNTALDFYATVPPPYKKYTKYMGISWYSSLKARTPCFHYQFGQILEPTQKFTPFKSKIPLSKWSELANCFFQNLD